MTIEDIFTVKLLFDLPYLPDVGTSSNTLYDHLLYICTVFLVLHKAGLRLKYKSFEKHFDIFGQVGQAS